MGTKFFESVNASCHEKRIKYMPFVGSGKRSPIVWRSVDSLIEEENIV